MATRSKERESPATGIPVHTPQDTAELLRELVAHLRQNRTELREEWARRITRAQLLTAMTEEEIFAEATSVRSEEHTSELQSQSNLVCRLLLEKKKKTKVTN